MRYFLGGVNGAGKTTLLGEIGKYFPEIEIVKGSKNLMDYLGISGNYDALRAMTQKERDIALRIIIENLLKNNDNFIFDAHYLNIVNGEISRVVDDWIQGFDAVILLDVSAKTALDRVKRDNRDRALFKKGLSEEEEMEIYNSYIEDTKDEFEKIIRVNNIPNLIINAENNLSAELEEFRQLHNSLISK
jgi:thymidylate kinase